MVQRRMGQRGWCTEGSSEKDGAQRREKCSRMVRKVNHFGVTIGRRIPAISVAFVMEDPLPLLTNGMGRSCVS